MSVSVILGTRLVVTLPKPSPGNGGGAVRAAPRVRSFTGDNGLVVECSSRPKKKATAHHMKTPPRKTQAWDIRRKPTVYAPLPSMPHDWALVTDDAAVAENSYGCCSFRIAPN